MERDEFLLQEYQTLREEIRETKSRIFKLAFGMLGIPTAYIIAERYQDTSVSAGLPVLSLSLPLIVMTLTLLFTAESRALMRTGRYIKNFIEPRVNWDTKPDPIANGAVLRGWETWLEVRSVDEPKRRIVDQLVSYFFYGLFVLYYIGSVLLASTAAEVYWSAKGYPNGYPVCATTYALLGVACAVFLAINFPQCNSTSYKTRD
jgi:hypothetical protein